MTNRQHQMEGLVNVLIEHHPNIGDIISNRYLKVMFKIPKIGHLPNPELDTRNIGLVKIGSRMPVFEQQLLSCLLPQACLCIPQCQYVPMHLAPLSFKVTSSDML